MSTLPSLSGRLPPTRGREATTGLPGFTHITLPRQHKLVRCLEARGDAIWIMETSAVSGIASSGVSSWGHPADEDHEVLTRPLLCLRWPTKSNLPTVMAVC